LTRKQDYAPFAVRMEAIIHTLKGFGFENIDILVENRFESCPRKTHLLLCMGFLMMFGMLALNAEAKTSMN